MLFMAKTKLAAMVTAAVLLLGVAGLTTYVVAAGGPSAKPAAPVQEGFRVNGLSFEVLAPAVVLTPRNAAPTPVSLSLKVTNGTDAPVTLNVFDTITLHMKDAAGKELRIDGGRDGTRTRCHRWWSKRARASPLSATPNSARWMANRGSTG